MSVDEAVPAESGQTAVSRRTVLGATFGGIGAATLVGVAAATSWPESGDNGAGGAVATGAGTPTGAGDSAQIDFTAAPAEGWEARVPVLPPAGGEREHRITVAAREGVGEVAPGTTQELWSFDDLVPGPVYRGRGGDRFAFTLANEGQVGHSIDFHASKVAWDDKMRTIQLIFVQSELYLGPDGQPGDLAKMEQEAWDAVVFNGYVNQYQHSPIRVEPGERVRAWGLDAGPSENCSFHVIGTIFDTVYKEGAYRLRPDGGSGGSQALDLQPAQGGFVEFTFDEPGLYPFVTHKFANPGKGALGMFQAGDVDPAAAAAGH